MTARRLFDLQEFLGTFFHEDWMLDDTTTLDVARRFRSATASRPSFRARVVAEIRELLDRPLSEGELHRYLLDEYSVVYDPWDDNLTTRAWLTSIAREIEGDAADPLIPSPEGPAP
jgi:hypothetical protein